MINVLTDLIHIVTTELPLKNISREKLEDSLTDLTLETPDMVSLLVVLTIKSVIISPLFVNYLIAQ